MAKDAVAAGIMLCLLLLGGWLPRHISISTSPSLDHRVFLLLPLSGGTKPIRTGDYMVFSHHVSQHIHRGLGGENDLLIKQVGCSPGEMLWAVSEGFSCQGTFLGKKLPRDGEGKSLPQFSYDGRIPEKKYFMVGQHERSFDSRYFGFIDADEFRYRALPLW